MTEIRDTGYRVKAFSFTHKERNMANGYGYGYAGVLLLVIQQKVGERFRKGKGRGGAKGVKGREGRRR